GSTEISCCLTRTFGVRPYEAEASSYHWGRASGTNCRLRTADTSQNSAHHSREKRSDGRALQDRRLQGQPYGHWRPSVFFQVGSGDEVVAGDDAPSEWNRAHYHPVPPHADASGGQWDCGVGRSRKDGLHHVGAGSQISNLFPPEVL